MEVENQNLTSQAKLWNYIYGYAETLVLKCAVQLDIANIIHNHGTPISLSDLASLLPNQPVNQDALYRVMRYLVHMKLFTKSSSNGETNYSIGPSGKFLVKGWEKCMVDSILVITDDHFMAPWHYLGHALSSKTSTAFEKARGTNIWEYLADHPEKNQLFNAAMANDTRLIMSAVVKECKGIFGGVSTLVDVGGGTGTAVKYVAKAFPDINCTVYDLPHVVADSSIDSGIKFVEGDMFTSVPNADAIMLKCILHDWDDDKCVEILKRCKEAIPKDSGKVIIIDVVLDVDFKHPYAKMRLDLDLDMMTIGGKERSEEEWKKIIYGAGYICYKITQISAIQSVIEVFPY